MRWTLVSVGIAWATAGAAWGQDLLAPQSQPAPATQQPAATSGPAATQPTTTGPVAALDRLENRRVVDLSIPEQLKVVIDLFNARRYADAEAVLSVIFRRDENNFEACILGGDMALAQKRPEAARQYYLRARKMQPGDFRANWGLGRIYVDRRIYRQAVTYLEIARPVAPPDKLSEVLVKLAQAYGGSGQTPKGFAALTEALASDPTNVDALNLMVSLRMTTNEYEPALDASAKLVEIARANLMREPGQRQYVQELDGAYDTRLRTLRAYHQTLYELLPDGRRSDRLMKGRESLAAAQLREMMNIAIIRAELQRVDTYFQALILFADRAVQYDPTNVEGLLTVAGLYASTSQWDLAVETYQRVLQIDPSNAEAQQRLDALMQQVSPATPTSQPAAESAPVDARVP